MVTNTGFKDLDITDLIMECLNFVIFDWYLSYSFRNCTLPWYRTDNSKMMRNVQSSELCFWLFPRSCWTIDLDQFKMKDNVSKLALWF